MPRQNVLLGYKAGLKCLRCTNGKQVQTQPFNINQVSRCQSALYPKNHVDKSAISVGYIYKDNEKSGYPMNEVVK